MGEFSKTILAIHVKYTRETASRVGKNWLHVRSYIKTGSFSLEMDNIFVLTLLLLLLRRRRRRRCLQRRECYVHSIYRRRPLLGEYHNLVPEMRLERPL